MILDRSLINHFIMFAENTFGVEVHRALTDASRSSEFCRFVLKERLYVIREFEDSRSDTVEVFSGDKAGLKEIEDMWTQLLHDTMQELEKGNSEQA